MDLVLYNTLTKKKEKFIPAKQTIICWLKATAVSGSNNDHNKKPMGSPSVFFFVGLII